MKKKNIILLIAVLHISRGVSAEEFEFDEVENDVQFTQQTVPASESPAVEFAKDVSAQLAQHVLWLYLVLSEWSKKITDSRHEQ